jgi:hypothetical protein
VARHALASAADDLRRVADHLRDVPCGGGRHDQRRDRRVKGRERQALAPGRLQHFKLRRLASRTSQALHDLLRVLN